MPHQRKPESMEEEERLAIAIGGYRSREWKSVYQAAKEMKVSKDTLGR
jgi:hypothetical protein